MAYLTPILSKLTPTQARKVLLNGMAKTRAGSKTSPIAHTDANQVLLLLQQMEAEADAQAAAHRQQLAGLKDELAGQEVEKLALVAELSTVTDHRDELQGMVFAFAAMHAHDEDDDDYDDEEEDDDAQGPILARIQPDAEAAGVPAAGEGEGGGRG